MAPPLAATESHRRERGAAGNPRKRGSIVGPAALPEAKTASERGWAPPCGLRGPQGQLIVTPLDRLNAAAASQNVEGVLRYQAW